MTEQLFGLQRKYANVVSRTVGIIFIALLRIAAVPMNASRYAMLRSQDGVQLQVLV